MSWSPSRHHRVSANAFPGPQISSQLSRSQIPYTQEHRNILSTDSHDTFVHSDDGISHLDIYKSNQIEEDFTAAQCKNAEEVLSAPETDEIEDLDKDSPQPVQIGYRYVCISVVNCLRVFYHAGVETLELNIILMLTDGYSWTVATPTRFQYQRLSSS